MPWYGFVHPLLAVGTIAFGIATAQTSVSRINDWNFPLRRQRNRSIIFFLMIVANFVVGLTVTVWLRGSNHPVRLSGHLTLAIITLGLALVGALVTFAKGRPGDLSSLMRLHPVVFIVCLVVILTMGFITVLSLFGV